MAVRPILTYPNPVLRQRSKRVRAIDESVERLIGDMLDTMHHGNGVGLAAPQIGVSLRVIVIELPEEEPLPLINPEIVKRSGTRTVEEGCLCVPGYRGKITRSEKVTAKALDRHGKEVRIKGEGLLAQVLEHETDHLGGVLYLDHLESTDDLYRIGDDASTPEA